MSATGLAEWAFRERKPQRRNENADAVSKNSRINVSFEDATKLSSAINLQKQQMLMS